MGYYADGGRSRSTKILESRRLVLGYVDICSPIRCAENFDSVSYYFNGRSQDSNEFRRYTLADTFGAFSKYEKG